MPGPTQGPGPPGAGARKGGLRSRKGGRRKRARDPPPRALLSPPFRPPAAATPASQPSHHSPFFLAPRAARPCPRALPLAPARSPLPIAQAHRLHTTPAAPAPLPPSPSLVRAVPLPRLRHLATARAPRATPPPSRLPPAPLGPPSSPASCSPPTPAPAQTNSKGTTPAPSRLLALAPSSPPGLALASPSPLALCRLPRLRARARPPSHRATSSHPHLATTSPRVDMQNTAATGHGAAQWSSVMHNQHHAQQHGQQQRNPANPRYPPDSAQGATDDPYGQSAWYQNHSAQYGGYNAASGYNAALPSSSRRTSNPKAATPPTSAPAGATASPSYYSARADVNSPATYQPASAPAQVLSHVGQQQPSYQQYGGYYDYQNQYSQHTQQQQQQQPQTAQSTHQPSHSHYSTPSAYAQQPAQQRQVSTGSVAADGRSAQSTSLDYNPQQYHDTSRYQTYQQQQQQQPQQPQPQQRSQQAVAWQGYPQAAQTVPGSAALNQYAWQPWQQQQHAAYYAQHASAAPAASKSAAQHHSHQPAAAAAAAVATPVQDSKVLGKRAAADSDNDEPSSAEKKPSHKKKGKKEPAEPVVPKVVAKSKLHPPKQAHSAWQLFFTDELEKAKAAHVAANETSHSPGGTVTQAKLNVAQVAKDAGIAYANMSDELKEHYKRRVEEGKAQYLIDKAAWEATLTPEDIKAENAFRAQQRKEGKSRKGNLKDPNAPKKPLSAYFLFLKGIRENDDLRRSVWAEETETTRQSVLAAERWRGLTDEEKKPYLTQAEKDKQEYENLRKAYEDDAAARARGETVPERAYVDLQNVSVIPPPSLLIPKPKTESGTSPVDGKADVKPEIKPDVKPGTSPVTAQPSTDPFLATPDQPSDPTFDEFPDFSHDTLGGHELDIGGLDGLVDSDPQWLAGIMHDAPSAAPAAETTSVAPAVSEALAQSGDARQSPPDVGSVLDAARAAEGALAVPPTLTAGAPAPGAVAGAESTTHSGQPTEEVNEMAPVVADDEESVGESGSGSEQSEGAVGADNV